MKHIVPCVSVGLRGPRRQRWKKRTSWPPVTPEGRVPRGGALEGRVPRGGALEGRVPRGRAPKRRMPRGGTLERIPEGGSPGGGTNSGDELVRELDQEARDVLEGRVPLGMEGGIARWWPRQSASGDGLGRF